MATEGFPPLNAEETTDVFYILLLEWTAKSGKRLKQQDVLKKIFLKHLND